MIDLTIQQNWLESSEEALEAFKSTLSDVLNNFVVDRHAPNRWEVTKISEGDTAHLIYDEQPIAGLRIEHKSLRFYTNPDVPRYDDIMYAVRYAAYRLSLSVHSNQHGRARLPSDPTLALDHTFFKRDAAFAAFFADSDFIPRYCVERYENQDNQVVGTVNPPFFLEHKNTGAIHIANYHMLDYLVQKDNHAINREFSYKVADSMDDFANKYDVGIIPLSFYTNYNKPVKLINDTHFDIDNIRRKVFIDPYVWDFDVHHSSKYYQNTKNGMHLMDKVRKGENLDTAIKRVLKEELDVAEDYVGGRVWGLDFDRDRDGILTPRVKINIFVHGLGKRQASKDHDWVSVK